MPADVLVVEGWIGRDGVRAAAKEFVNHGYKHVVASGGMTTAERWEGAVGVMPRVLSTLWWIPVYPKRR